MKKTEIIEAWVNILYHQDQKKGKRGPNVPFEDLEERDKAHYYNTAAKLWAVIDN